MRLLLFYVRDGHCPCTSSRSLHSTIDLLRLDAKVSLRGCEVVQKILLDASSRYSFHLDKCHVDIEARPQIAW